MSRSQKRKKTDNLTVFFALLGSVRVKAWRKTLMKLTPDVCVETKTINAAQARSALLSLSLSHSLSHSLSLSPSLSLSFP